MSREDIFVSFKVCFDLFFATFLTCFDGFLHELKWFFKNFQKLISVLSWISVLGGNLLKSNKRPALNKCPGKTFLSVLKCFDPIFCNIFNLFWWFSAWIEIIFWNFSKINKYPVLNKDVLGGKLSKNNKNVLEYYSEDHSTLKPSWFNWI